MSEKSNNTLPVILLVVGLVVGCGGGYFFANNTFQPQVEALEEQITSTNTEISSVITQIADAEGQVDDLAEEVNDLGFERTQKATEYNSIQSELEITQDALTEVINRKNELKALVTPLDGCYKVNLFGFSFDCPTEVTLEAAGATDATFGDSVCSFAATDSNEQYEIDASWVSLPYVDGLVEAYMEEMVRAIADYYDITLTGLQNTTIADCPAQFVIWTGTYEDYTNGIIAIFYCDTNNKLYIIEYDSVEAVDMGACYAILDSVRVS